MSLPGNGSGARINWGAVAQGVILAAILAVGKMAFDARDDLRDMKVKVAGIERRLALLDTVPGLAQRVDGIENNARVVGAWRDRERDEMKRAINELQRYLGRQPSER